MLGPPVRGGRSQRGQKGRNQACREPLNLAPESSPSQPWSAQKLKNTEGKNMTHSLLGVRALKGSPPNGRAVSLERTDNVGVVHRAWEVLVS